MVNTEKPHCFKADLGLVKAELILLRFHTTSPHFSYLLPKLTIDKIRPKVGKLLIEV